MSASHTRVYLADGRVRDVAEGCDNVRAAVLATLRRWMEGQQGKAERRVAPFVHLKRARAEGNYYISALHIVEIEPYELGTNGSGGG